MPHLDAVVSLSRFVIAWVSGLLNRIFKGLLRPSSASTLVGGVVDLSRSKTDLIAENALFVPSAGSAKAAIEAPAAESS
jgi:hypothetical protein